jgi:hypothetical protein
MVPTTVLLICGLIGIIVVLGFAIASGAGNGTFDNLLEKNKCPTTDTNGMTKPVPYSAVAVKASYKLSTLSAAGSCPVGYTSFTDMDGASLCCASSNIDVYSRKCAAKGAESICAMAPGIPDTRNLGNAYYPECKLIAKQQTQALSGKLCPMAFPNYATLTGSGYKCCSGPLAPGGTDCLGGGSCTGLSNGQNVFNTPSSCEKSLLLEQTQCPAGTHMVPDMKGSATRTRDLMIPLCVGGKGNCIARTVLVKLRTAGYFTDIDLDKNILNCDVYDKVYNDRLLDINQVETAKSTDL